MRPNLSDSTYTRNMGAGISLRNRMVQSVGPYYQFTRNEMLSDSHDAERNEAYTTARIYVREGRVTARSQWGQLSSGRPLAVIG